MFWFLWVVTHWVVFVSLVQKYNSKKRVHAGYVYVAGTDVVSQTQCQDLSSPGMVFVHVSSAQTLIYSLNCVSINKPWKGQCQKFHIQSREVFINTGLYTMAFFQKSVYYMWYLSFIHSKGISHVGDKCLKFSTCTVDAKNQGGNVRV